MDGYCLGMPWLNKIHIVQDYRRVQRVAGGARGAIPVLGMATIGAVTVVTDISLDASNGLHNVRSRCGCAAFAFTTVDGFTSSVTVPGCSPGSWLWCHVQETNADAGMLGPTTTTVTKKKTQSITMCGRTAACTLNSRGVTTITENRTMDR